MSYRQFAIFLKNELLPVFADYRWKPLAFTCDGGRVAVEAETIGRAKDGREYQQQHHILFVVKRGKIVSVRDYLDTLYSARFFATSIPPKDRLTNSEAELQNDKSAHGNGNGSDTGHDGETAKMKL
ncbi:hypothetical protein M427DRAFT_451454 [Gonapodya prolifera JEL478]|uniref:SnoaL-like domain-containing protein n=1 Tax=Gonapodya prolifera (strain JEL478) TaxID=1344416 RepID=A0A139ARV2_GONPJ|nr:hypothetical protein M427DRAFT_451454 [Gonapodya prolifera JEL478]|eukprot:KXS19478.1 hypothetical protein M427DRAFT_451454 [Gonapodya prolifera JEL478]